PGRLRPTAAAAFLAGSGFGPAGILGFALGEPLILLLISGVPLPALLAAGADALLAAFAYLTFRDAGRVGRGLPNLRSYLWFLAAATLGSLTGAFVLAWGGFADRLAAGTALHAAGNLTSVVLGGLPLLFLAHHRLRRWLVPLPAELPSPPFARLRFAPSEDEGAAADDSEATRIVTPRRVSSGEAGLWVVVLLGITVLAAPILVSVPESGFWVALLYLLPVIKAAQLYGMRGGLLAASGCALACLVGAAAGTWWIDEAESFRPLPLYAQFLLLSPLAAYLGHSWQNEARLRMELVSHHRLLRQDLLRVVNALVAAVEAKDAYTESHLRRVGEYAVAVGGRLGLAGRDLEVLYFGAVLHDIGKIGVPESVIRKQGPLDAEEEALMRRHPEIGARIVSELDVLRDTAPLILHHQERWDGGDETLFPGYPHGLTGDAIPLGARIIAVVDAFDAMTTDRPYRASLGQEAAVTELRRQAGRQFDPRVVDAFVEVLAERPWL
ncbi:MAG TPA: HD-GYP domain-containing protein, partial [Thermoanaerobaculia bacterium]|nr:HD-GYP domain-containing protein [Thermoanaerobaculia bacterium]